MTIKNDDVLPQEALLYNNIAMDELSLRRMKQDSDSSIPQYYLNFIYHDYAVDSSGDHHQGTNENDIKDGKLNAGDFYALAKQKELEGDTTYITWLTDTEELFSKLLVEINGINARIE